MCYSFWLNTKQNFVFVPSGSGTEMEMEDESFFAPKRNLKSVLAAFLLFSNCCIFL